MYIVGIIMLLMLAVVGISDYIIILIISFKNYKGGD